MVRLRRASGGREEVLLKRAETLRRSSDPLLPERTKDCPPEPFDRLKDSFEEVRSFRDDSRRLDSLRRWGEPFARAYAGFLRFYLEPELPTLLPARLGGIELSYAPLARAPAEFQIAVQQYDDPRRLLLGYLALARKGFYFYALPDRLLCTGRDPDPPAEFLRKQGESLPYRFNREPDGGRFLCPHLAERSPVPWVGVDWAPAGRSFRVCSGCARSDAQLLGALAAGLAQPRAEQAFELAAELNVDCRGGPDCIHHRLPPINRRLRGRYEAGRISDKEFLEEFTKEQAEVVARGAGRLFVAGGICFGSDVNSFIDALQPNSVERSALVEVLPSVDGLFELGTASASQALERLWRSHAEEVVAAIERDPEEARRLVQEARASPGRVSELLRRAAQRSEERDRLKLLPSYRALGREAAFVDGVGRSFRAGGATAAERHLEQNLPREGKERGLAWGLLLALDRSGPHGWQFSETEKNFGASLAPLAKELLTVPPAEYGRALGSLLSAAGVAGELR